MRYLKAEGLPMRAQAISAGRCRGAFTITRRPDASCAVCSAVSDRYTINREEHDYGSRLQQQQPAGEIELFGESAMTNRKTPVRVLIVDNSAVMRQLLTGLLEADPEIEVVGTAADPYIARERIKALNPDVITLDVEMPHMDGLTFSAQDHGAAADAGGDDLDADPGGAEMTLEALEIGAVDFVAKPTHDQAERMAELAEELQQKVKAAAQVRVGARRAAGAGAPPRAPAPPDRTRSFLSALRPAASRRSRRCCMGLPADCPPILITQHMPPRFTTGFAERLNRECPMTVSEAADGEAIEAGHVYIAPGSHHLEIVRAGNGHMCRLSDGPPVSGHRPSVDVLFRSAARVCAKSAVGAILTGMGKDGAEGLLELRHAGGVDARPGRRDRRSSTACRGWRSSAAR